MAKGTSKELTRAQLKRFKSTLETKASEICRDLRSAADHRALVDGEDSTDLEDMPVQSHEQWIFVNRNNIDKLLLREIREAIHSIEEGTYGTCLECEKPISAKRLAAVPWARYCVPCQERLSRSHEDGPEARLSSYGR